MSIFVCYEVDREIEIQTIKFMLAFVRIFSSAQIGIFPNRKWDLLQGDIIRFRSFFTLN